jgi:hypothetical protein
MAKLVGLFGLLALAIGLVIFSSTEALTSLSMLLILVVVFSIGIAVITDIKRIKW